MHEDYSSIARVQRRGSGQWKSLVVIGVATFLLGAALVGFAWWNGMGTADFVQVKRETPQQLASPATPAGAPAPVPSPTASATATEASAAEARKAAAKVEQVAEQAGGLDSRVAALEQRMTKLDLQAQAAAGNAARAEGLLIAFAARRAIERGAPLGYLGDQLQLRFGDAKPIAVQTVIEASRNPVTLDQLMARLDGLAPTLVGAPKDEGAFNWLGRELSGLFVIRRESTPSPEPERRLERARLFLESGRPEAAVAEVRNLPNAAAAAGWIADAERYAKAQRALELLETTAILDPLGLRDGAGNKVQQPSPAASDATVPAAAN